MYSKGLNFACPLHNWAFQQYLEKKGIESTIIDYIPNYYDGFNLKYPADSYAQKVELWKKKYQAALQSGNEKDISLAEKKIQEHTKLMEAFTQLRHEREIRYDKFQNFIDSRYIKTAQTYDSSLLEVEDPGFDCYICVTDAIWKKEPGFGYEPGFFLASSCMENKWKISYAASTYFTESADDIQLTENWIRDIDFVSVREDFLQKRLEKNVCPNVSHVVDPVLLHDSDFYEQILTPPREKGYLLLYYVMNQNPDIIKHALHYAKTHHLKIVELSDQPAENDLVQASGVEVIYRYDVGIEEWLGYIKHADCIFTNSFHACCFSILFQKLFFAERRKYDKVGALLAMVGLSDCLIDPQNFSAHSLPEIDWNSVHEKLLIKRSESEKFILDSINFASQNERPFRDYMRPKKKQYFPFYYNIGTAKRSLTENLSDCYNEQMGKIFLRPKSIEFLPSKNHETNDGTGKFHQNIFKIDGFRFKGWRLRIKIGSRHFYLLENNTLIENSKYNAKMHGPCKIFSENSPIPILPFVGIQLCVAEAQWENAADICPKPNIPNTFVSNNSTNMKIGLISINMYSKRLNFACPLHNWAFQKFLEQNGIQSTIIDYTPNYYDNFDLRHPVNYYNKKVEHWEKKYESALKTGKQADISLAAKKLKEHSQLRDSFSRYYHERASRYDKFQNFIDSNYIKTSEKYDSALLEIKDPGFDCYICVTDAIWKKEPYYGYEPGFFLASKCMDNKQKIAYAASTYFTESEEDQKLTEAWIRDIDYVFVREDFMKKSIQAKIREDVNQVVDPVLLHTADFYEDIIIKPKEENYLLLYYVMDQNPAIAEQAIKYARANNLKIIEISDQADENDFLKTHDPDAIFKYNIGIEEWLGYLKYATCVFTNSFHACCFCILFETIFFAGRRKYDKVGAVLDMVGLSQQISNTQELSSYELPKINWESVRNKLSAKRKESQLLILGAIYAASHNSAKRTNYLEQRKNQEFPLFYNIGKKAKSLTDNLSSQYNENMGKLFIRPNSLEFLPVDSKIKNDGSAKLHDNIFKINGFRFKGWRLRVKVENRNFLMLENGTFIDRNEYRKEKHGSCKIFHSGEPMPVINLNCIKNCVAEAQWDSLD